MKQDEFFQTRKEDWERLDRLLARGQKGVSRLSPEEIRSLGRLYRSATADLALAQRDYPRARLTEYLNRLTARAHEVIYRSEPFALRRFFHFIRAGFPRAFRSNLPFTLVAVLLFAIPALAAAISTAVMPDTARWLLPASSQALIPSIENKELWTHIPLAKRPYTSSFIMQNNLQVAFLAFSGGIPGGLFTVWVMAFNGLLLGGLTGLTIYHGIGFELWTFVIGHGVIELSVIFIAGGAGLSLGWAVIHPGLLRRGDALVLAARRSIRLLIGCVPLLMIAGLIEGFISPAEGLPAVLKWATGLGTGILLHGYLLFAGRLARPRVAEPGPA
jgi:uncharacterized membrane protein SpoIIM required for sporulation